ncbi:MAG: rod shape-determining protein RodA [Bacteroides sp.]|nr:rod shape-determining protein RodA [Roseburia sp.]MCM1346382.1 rod shape-determining protein RodA [Bacteroides sp.]MCM1420117.1 rod shape-determining protein RodA [Bacteroides sp.]
MQNEGRKGVVRSLDWWTIGLYLILVTWGWFSVCGASYDFSNPDVFSLSCNSGKQLLWVGTSVCLAGILLLIEKRFFDTASYYIYIVMIVVLLVTIVIAPETKGSRSWLPIGTFMKIQPAEFAKFAVALAIGKYMDRYGFNIDNLKDFARVVGLILLPMVLIVCQKETGTALVYFAFFLVLYREGMTGAFLFSAFAAVVYFVVGMRFCDDFISDMPVSVGEFTVLLLAMVFTIGMTWVFCRNALAVKIMLFGGVGTTLIAYFFSAYVIPFNVCHLMLAVNVAIILYLIGLAFYTRVYKYILITLFAISSTSFFYMCHRMFNALGDHQRVRIEVLLGMKEDIRGAGYNVNQAKIAIGSGGFEGKGFLNGTQTKLKYVPEQDTDFIFCTVGEEEGFIGSSAVLLVYLLFIWRLIYVAERQPDTLGRVYGYSVASIFLFHLFVNVGMVLGLTPVIGIPLPFFSYGGSSLWGFTILLFVFLRMDAERNLKKR